MILRCIFFDHITCIRGRHIPVYTWCFNLFFPLLQVSFVHYRFGLPEEVDESGQAYPVYTCILAS